MLFDNIYKTVSQNMNTSTNKQLTIYTFEQKLGAVLKQQSLI